MSVKVKIKRLKPGTVFNAGPVAVRVLEHFADGKTLVITDECIADRPFTCQPFKPNRPEDWKANNWRTSTLRADLNRDFLNSFDEAGGPILSENIIPAEWDLTDSAGNNTYGSVTDKIGLLTEAMFRKYSEQGLLDLDDWWWLITPYAGLSTSRGMSTRTARCTTTTRTTAAGAFGRLCMWNLKSKSNWKKTKSTFPLPPCLKASQRASLWKNCSGE